MPPSHILCVHRILTIAPCVRSLTVHQADADGVLSLGFLSQAPRLTELALFAPHHAYAFPLNTNMGAP